MKYLNMEAQVVKKFKDSAVSRRKISLNFPSLSIQCLADSSDHGRATLVAELILYSLDISMVQYLDYRKDVNFRSHTFYILHKDLQDPTASLDDLQDPGFKNVILGPITSKKQIRTTNMFYNELVSHLKQHNADF